MILIFFIYFYESEKSKYSNSIFILTFLDFGHQLFDAKDGLYCNNTFFKITFFYVIITFLINIL